MKIAIFGGTFDPIHEAHLAIARAAVRECGLDRVLFVPAANPPHKDARTHAGYTDRLRMVALACEGEPTFCASRLEENTAQSYSINTIERLKPELAPDDRLYFLIGADAFAEIRTWRRWRDVLAAVEFIVVSRPGYKYDPPAEARVHRLHSVALDVSSSEIRKRLGHNEEPSGVPAKVLAYIRARQLYSIS